MTPRSWPARPTCHGVPGEWLEMWQPDIGEIVRVCWFCKSLSPGDTFASLSMGAGLHLLTGTIPFWMGFIIGNPTSMVRFWPQHLADEGYDPDALAALLDLIYRRSGYWFEPRPGVLPWRWGQGVKASSA